MKNVRLNLIDPVKVTISGSFRKHGDAIFELKRQLSDNGLKVLAPRGG